MKRLVLLLALAGCGEQHELHVAKGRQSCDELLRYIDQRIKARGVKKYTLKVKDSGQDPQQGKVVGVCEGGTKKIVYLRQDA